MMGPLSGAENAPLLPHDRDMTVEEQRGFRIACACFETFGRQLAETPVTLAGPARAASQARMQDAGQVMVGIAKAMDITLGRGQRPARL